MSRTLRLIFIKELSQMWAILFDRFEVFWMKKSWNVNSQMDTLCNCPTHTEKAVERRLDKKHFALRHSRVYTFCPQLATSGSVTRKRIFHSFLLLKVSQIQNEYMRSSLLPKFKPKITSISVLPNKQGS